MGNSHKIGFKRIIGYDDLFHYSDFELISTEVYVLWCLGTYGPMTSYNIYLKKKKFPYPEDAIAIPEKRILELSKDPTDYCRSTIDDSVRKLEDKGLVKILDRVSKEKRTVGLTFSGLIWCMANVKDGFNHVFEVYSGLFPLRTVRKHLLCEEYQNLVPFLPLWKTMTKTLGEAMCLEELERTAKNFFALEKTKLKIDAFDLEVEGYLQTVPPLWMKTKESEYYDRFAQRCKGERNQKIVNFIKKPENMMLLKSYIAYLAIHDLNEISKLSQEETIKVQSKLDSEKELSYLEEREIGTNSIFSKERLQEFYTNYSRIEYFFTGMFMDNLIWSKNSK